MVRSFGFTFNVDSVDHFKQSRVKVEEIQGFSGACFVFALIGLCILFGFCGSDQLNHYHIQYDACVGILVAPAVVIVLICFMGWVMINTIEQARHRYVSGEHRENDRRHANKMAAGRVSSV